MRRDDGYDEPLPHRDDDDHDDEPSSRRGRGSRRKRTTAPPTEEPRPPTPPPSYTAKPGPGPDARQQLADLAEKVSSSAEAKPAEWSRFGNIEEGAIVD